MQAPGNLDLDLYQGATWSYVLTWKIADVPVDLSGYTARLQARPSARSADIALDLATGSGITLGGQDGTVTLTLSATQTAALSPGKYLYDLELESAGGEVTRLVQGTLTVSPEVTR